MSKHTPGPWIVNAEQVFGNGYKIASVNTAGHDWQANRDLIATAPELLALLSRAVEACRSSAGAEERTNFIRDARAAIAKIQQDKRT